MESTLVWTSHVRLPRSPGWDVEQRELNLHESPSGQELRMTKGFPTSVELLDGVVPG